MKSLISKKIEEATIKSLKKRITKLVSGAVVLDNGCNEGSFEYEKHTKKKIYGIDVIESGILNRGAVEFKMGDAVEIPYPNEMFDCVVFAGVIQYVDKRDQSLEEIWRVLKSGGKLIIATVNRESLLRCLKIIDPKPKSSAGEKKMFSFYELKSLLKNNNFNILKEKGVDCIWLPKKLCSNQLIVAEKS